MVQAPDFGDWHDLPQLRPLDRSPVRRVLGEGEVGPGAVVVLEVPGEDVSQVALAQDEDMVETLSADRADQTFGEGILPWTLSGREDLLDPHPVLRLNSIYPTRWLSETLGSQRIVDQTIKQHCRRGADVSANLPRPSSATRTRWRQESVGGKAR
jgi:hypothetical protein